MKNSNLVTIIVILVAALTIQSCKDASPSASSGKTAIDKNWIQYYQDRGETRALVGHAVTLLRETDSSFVIDIKGGVELNVPKVTEHLVRIVDINGFAAVDQDVKDFDSDTEHIRAAIKWRNETSKAPVDTK